MLYHFKAGKSWQEVHWVYPHFFLFFLWFAFLSLFFNLLSDCKDRLYQQLENKRLLTNELRVALNGNKFF